MFILENRKRHDRSGLNTRFFYLTSYLIDMSKYNVNTTVKYQYQLKTKTSNILNIIIIHIYTYTKKWK